MGDTEGGVMYLGNANGAWMFNGGCMFFKAINICANHPYEILLCSYKIYMSYLFSKL